MSKPQKLPSGQWRIRFINADGKRKSKTFTTYDLARTELRRLEVGAEETKVRRERFGSAEMTVAEAWEVFKAGRKRDPNNTERRFLSRGVTFADHFKMHIEPHIGEAKLCDLTPKALREWIAKLAETKTAYSKGERTLSASTIRNIVTTLRQICKANDVLLQVMLAEGLRQKRKRYRPKALQCIEDVRALLRGCESVPWFRVAAAIACHVGARLGEIASLRWRHVGDETITIALSWEGPLKARYEDDEESARVVPLDSELVAILEQWRRVTGGGPDDHVVLVAGKRPLREGRDDMATLTRNACKRAGLTPLTFHSLRASYATIAADGGLPILKLAAVLGHADVKTTGIYLRPESAHAALDPRARIGGHKMDTSGSPTEALTN